MRQMRKLAEIGADGVHILLHHVHELLKAQPVAFDRIFTDIPIERHHPGRSRFA